MRRPVFAVFGSILLLTTVTAPTSQAASPGTCWGATSGNFHSGNRIFPGDPRGVSAAIEFYNEALCINAGSMLKSFSSSWVALVANAPVDDNTYNIYQVGFIKCQTTGCPTGSVWVWAYGHQQGPCGARVSPTAHFLTSASSTVTHKVDRVVQSGIGTTYAVYVNGSMKNWQYYTQLETCWQGGPKGYFVSNETGDRNDQSGGEVSPVQDFSSIKWKDSSSVWRAMNGIKGIGCNPAPSLSTQKCRIDPAAADGIETWDTRVP